MFIRSPELDYAAPLVTVATDGHCVHYPVISAGAGKSVSGTSTSLTGTATSQCGDSLSYQWRYLSGPGTVTFGTSTLLTTTATVSQTGVYKFRLNVTDGYWHVIDTIMVVFT
jgi:hypothetical protein